MKQSKKPIIFLLGPTAAGKTDWAINWQNQFEFLEIISVDSVMVYKECNIGSAKPSKEVLEKHPHRLINHVSVKNIFSVADFYDEALQLIKDTHLQDKIPLLVGGSMMYFNLLKNGISSLPSADKNLRKKLKEKIVNEGVESLHEDLLKLDPEAAKQIKSKDSQRIIRAIEIITSTGKSIDAAVKEACSVRFRPIMMTSLSTMIAMLPLVIGNIGPGAGEGSRLAVGATILGGMIISTFFTLYVTPTMYLTLAKNTKRIDAVDIELKKQLN